MICKDFHVLSLPQYSTKAPHDFFICLTAEHCGCDLSLTYYWVSDRRHVLLNEVTNFVRISAEKDRKLEFFFCQGFLHHSCNFYSRRFLFPRRCSHLNKTFFLSQLWVFISKSLNCMSYVVIFKLLMMMRDKQSSGFV